jgi:cyclophilin family peptidyl-prolyl cis-trans isomerase
MKRSYLPALLFIPALVAGCTWTGPGPTFTPRPTWTPKPTKPPAPTPTPGATHTPAPAADTEAPASTLGPTVVPAFPAMPANVAERNQMFQSPPPPIIDPSRHYKATIQTARGDIVCELNADQAPLTVNNFVYLARAGFYDGLTFHRVEPGFVIQGGDPLGRGDGGPGYTVPAELGLPHPKGALAMARLSDQVNPKRESSGSQFYITLAATPHLDGSYTVFGQVIEGMSVAENIQVGDLIQAIAISEQE